jgi:molybdopterin biosynthesis enzyme
MQTRVRDLTRAYSRPDRVLDAVMTCIADAIGHHSGIGQSRSMGASCRFDAALAGWHMLGRAMLMRLTGNAEPPCLRAAKLTRKVSSTAGLAELVAVRCEGSLATPLASGYVPISALGRANGWILIPSESEGWPEHSEVAVRPWP